MSQNRLVIPIHEYDLASLCQELTSNLLVKWHAEPPKPTTPRAQPERLLPKGAERFLYVAATDWTRPLTVQYKQAGLTNDQGERYVKDLALAPERGEQCEQGHRGRLAAR